MKKTKDDLAFRKRSMTMEVVQRLARNKMAMLGLAIVVIMALLCLAAPLIAPFDYDEQNIMIKFTKPNSTYIMGTDNLGRDIFSRILYGGRISMCVGLVSTAISAILGTILGAIAGFYGGKIDNIIMRILDVFMAMPTLLLAISISAILGSGVSSAMIAVGVSQIPNFTRIVRGPILAIKGQEFVESARSIDASDRRIIFKHILPNVLSPLIVQISLSVANGITTAAGLSFLGFGVQPPNPEWGAMLSGGRQYIRDFPYLVTFPGLAIALIVVSMNLFGDGLRDALDPRLKD